ncbi:MAG: helicase-associated domain-containing protein [Kineosporiaceae bacterium]
MTTASDLRGLGPEGLADLLERRPDVAGPVMPLSLAEVAARLAQPRSQLLAVQRLDTPAVQVAEALAHLGPDADRAVLVRFLHLADPDGLAALDRCLAMLAAFGLLGAGGGLAPGLAQEWRRPYGLGPRLAEVLSQWTVDRLRAVLVTWGEPTAGRKADLVSRLAAVLADADRVGAALAEAPAEDREALVAGAGGDGAVDLGYVGWDGRARGRVVWPFARGLVTRDWSGRLVMAAEVALAIRGPGWRPPFDWRLPPITWVPVARGLADREATAAAAATLRLTTSLIVELEVRPAALTRDGVLGKRETKRLAKVLGVAPREVRFAVGLAFAAALIAHVENGDALAATRDAEVWRASPPADRLLSLLHTWLGMVQVPLAAPDEPWHPMPDPSWGRRRVVPLHLLSMSPGHAPTDPAELVRAGAWLTPEGGPRPPGRVAPDPAVDLRGLLAESVLLGLTGAGALSSLGEAVADDGDPGHVLRTWLGAARETARLQSDLTAVVLGDPSARLARVLDGMADRESGDQAHTWRFNTGSVGRALDAGHTADALVAALAAVADDDVPQPLEYLVRDTGRRHGVLRAGSVACYVRSDDHARLAEAAADSRLRRLGLRVLAPGVLVGELPLPETLARLRAAGYLPVQEGPDGAVVPVERAEVRAEVSDFVRELAPRPAPPGEGVTSWDLAEAMLALPDAPQAPLLEIHGTVVDSRSMREAFDALLDGPQA